MNTVYAPKRALRRGLPSAVAACLGSRCFFAAGLALASFFGRPAGLVSLAVFCFLADGSPSASFFALFCPFAFAPFSLGFSDGVSAGASSARACFSPTWEESPLAAGLVAALGFSGSLNFAGSLAGVSFFSSTFSSGLVLDWPFVFGL